MTEVSSDLGSFLNHLTPSSTKRYHVDDLRKVHPCKWIMSVSSAGFKSMANWFVDGLIKSTPLEACQTSSFHPKLTDVSIEEVLSRRRPGGESASDIMIDILHASRQLATLKKTIIKGRVEVPMEREVQSLRSYNLNIFVSIRTWNCCRHHYGKETAT